ncbi:hypothetical protein [Mesorhizobium sp. ES1-1]|uniref:hypothetical protein n=1 Tax=Mesorhizobium sp. ES1-1 TaxID=2876629 RepID=UPI001CCEEF9F|nr:hypothetical protein [Mesorhizobium sp. ES1-1]MBZ9674610.1 hypothetical protein [Mesorhizobium sp. ES1-1]
MIHRKAREAGIVKPTEIGLLFRVFDRTQGFNETPTEQEARASRIIANYTAGIMDEQELIALSRQAVRR